VSKPKARLVGIETTNKQQTNNKQKQQTTEPNQTNKQQKQQPNNKQTTV
jgi:hypothetical protein